MARPWLLLALVASCDAPAPPVESPPPDWVYAPAPTGWPLGAVQGRFGRAQAPQTVVSLGITGTQPVPLRLATLWEVPGEDKPARAAVYGLEGAKPAIELIEVDAGRVVWRDTALCTGPIVGVTSETIVCSDGAGIRGVTLDGKVAWRSERGFAAMTDDRIVAAGDGEAVILDAATGEELSRVKLPQGVMLETIVATCGDAGRELFAVTADHALVRIADVKGKPQITWRAPFGTFEAIDACTDDFVLAEADDVLLTYIRANGGMLQMIEGVRGWWPARDGSDRVEIATLGGVTSWTRDFRDPRAVLFAPFGELLAKRGDRRLVRATKHTAVLLDRAGVAAYVQIGTGGAVLGDTVIIGSDWVGSPANTLQRFALPPRYPRALRLPMPARGVAVPTELRDLPEAAPIPDNAIAKRDTGKASVGPVAIDPITSHIVYVAAGEGAIDDDSPSTIAAFDLVAKSWRWERSDACGGGTIRAIVVTSDVIACGTQGKRPGTAVVRATSRDGVARWEWEGDGVDALAASGSLVLVTAGERAYILDAATGRPRLTLAADDGGVAAALVESAQWGSLVIAAQQGRLVARAANLGMLPVWSLAIDGVAIAVHAAGEGVLVELEDGDAYRIAGDGTVTGVAGLGLEWHTSADLLAGLTAGGAIYGPPVAVKPGIAPAIHGIAHKLLAPDDPEMPNLWKPIAPPPVIGAGHQLTIYEPDGGVRVRAEYNLGGQRAWTVRGPAGSPIVLVTDTPQHEALVIDPRTGDPLKRFALPIGAHAFSTTVNGSPVSGVMLADPLRVVVF